MKQAGTEALLAVFHEKFGDDAELTEERLDAFYQELTGGTEEGRALFHQAGELLRENETLPQMAREDSPEGFKAFYHLVFGQEIPKHALEEWIEPLYGARESGRGVVIEAFRGSTKTTTLTIGFTAYRIGLEPEKANLLIQVGDDIATDNTEAIADIIANSPGWKLVFPKVEPDREKGWGAGGYEVKRTDMEYADWRKLNANRKDPTLMGVGYKSRAIIGKHPDGVLVVDDIHDENNTFSMRELQGVIQRLTGTIFPTITENTWVVFVGTPWTDDDTLAYVKGTGEFVSLKTPVYRKQEGTGTVFQEEEVELVWPDRFTLAEVEKQLKLAGQAEFGRMFELDLERAKVSGLKFLSYPHELIKGDWWTAGGCDYASIVSENQRLGESGRSYFALAVIAKIPTGGAVIVDGFVDRVTQAQAEAQLEKFQNLYPNWSHTIVEGDGKGEEFISVVMRKPHLRIVPMKTRGKGKRERHERQMAPWFENGMVRISDADTKFLNWLRKFFTDYPNGNLDVGDAAYWALRAVPDVLVMVSDQETIKTPDYFQKKTNAHPMASFGRV